MNSHVFLNENNITALYNFKPLASVCNKLTSMLEGKGSNMHHAVIRNMIMKGHCECSIIYQEELHMQSNCIVKWYKKIRIKVTVHVVHILFCILMENKNFVLSTTQYRNYMYMQSEIVLAKSNNNFNSKYNWVFELTVIIIIELHVLPGLFLYGVGCVDCRGRDRMTVGSTNTCAISAYHHVH
jgi:hypothetical protein